MKTTLLAILLAVPALLCTSRSASAAGEMVFGASQKVLRPAMPPARAECMGPRGAVQARGQVPGTSHGATPDVPTMGHAMTVARFRRAFRDVKREIGDDVMLAFATGTELPTAQTSTSASAIRPRSDWDSRLDETVFGKGAKKSDVVNSDQPRSLSVHELSSGQLVTFRNHVFQESYYLTRSFRSRATPSARQLQEQPWLEWDPASNRFHFRNEGASQAILRMTVGKPLYRGTTALEARYMRGIRRILRNEMSGVQRTRFADLLGTIVAQWEASGSQKTRLQGLIARLRSGPDFDGRERRETALFLSSLISKDAPLFTTTSERGAQFFREAGRRKGVILQFDGIDNSGREDVYAGVEKVFGAFEVGPENYYLEVGYLTPEAKLFLIEHLSERSR